MTDYLAKLALDDRAELVERTKHSSSVAAAITQMRRAGAAGQAVKATDVARWASVLLEGLYQQKPARWEHRAAGDFSQHCWIQADANDVFYAHARKREVRALYEHPSVLKPLKAHVWVDGRCRDCDEVRFLAGPDCIPAPPTPPDPRTVLPVKADWFIRPLEQLHYLAKHQNNFERRKTQTEADFLLGKLRAFIKETSP